MNPANATSGSASGTMSSSAPTKHPEESPTAASGAVHAPAAPSEGDYLKTQAAAAAGALAEAFSDLKGDLARGADPRVWMKSHPWITLGSAAVAGFAAAAAAIPSKEQQALRKLEAIERALHVPRTAQDARNGHEVSAADGKNEGGGFLGVILHEVLGALKPMLISLLTARMGGQGTPPDGAPQTGQGSGRADDVAGM